MEDDDDVGEVTLAWRAELAAQEQEGVGEFWGAALASRLDEELVASITTLGEGLDYLGGLLGPEREALPLRALGARVRLLAWGAPGTQEERVLGLWEQQPRCSLLRWQWREVRRRVSALRVAVLQRVKEVQRRACAIEAAIEEGDDERAAAERAKPMPPLPRWPARSDDEGCDTYPRFDLDDYFAEAEPSGFGLSGWRWCVENLRTEPACREAVFAWAEDEGLLGRGEAAVLEASWRQALQSARGVAFDLERVAGCYDRRDVVNGSVSGQLEWGQKTGLIDGALAEEVAAMLLGGGMEPGWTGD
jgi:hypothetical protein